MKSAADVREIVPSFLVSSAHLTPRSRGHTAVEGGTVLMTTACPATAAGRPRDALALRTSPATVGHYVFLRDCTPPVWSAGPILGG